jgi:alpha-galactosidase/6-phospho-beta-glucosidase family protein
MLLTEERVTELVTLATKYAISRNLDVDCYLEAMLNPDNMGNSDAKIVVENLIKYHKEWLQKS